MTARGEAGNATTSLDTGSFEPPATKFPTVFKCAPHLDEFMATKMAELQQANAVVHFIFDVSREVRKTWPHIRESVIWVRANGELLPPRKIRQSYMDSPRPAIDMVLEVIKRAYSIQPVFKEILTVYSDVPLSNEMAN